MLTNILDYEDLPAPLPPKPEGAYHRPVLPVEVEAFLRPAPGMTILDGTAGGGGHCELMLAAGARVIALDQDEEAIAECGARLAKYGEQCRLFQANYAEADVVLDALGIPAVNGALLDVGVSSHQLECAERGFSFLREGPLDMRMNRSGSMTAEVLLNTADPAELTLLFREYGEEPQAAKIAGRIAQVRRHSPLRTTADLVACIESVVPRTGPRHPATRVFQALRIAVNDELGCLSRGLDVISRRLAPGARFVVISFHSLEDRIVKRFFRERSAQWIDRPEWPAPRPNPDRMFRLLTPRPLEASLVEATANPRARSAKLRAVERLGGMEEEA